MIHKYHMYIILIIIELYSPVIFIVIMANSNESASCTTCKFIFFGAPFDTDGGTIDSNKD